MKNRVLFLFVLLLANAMLTNAQVIHSATYGYATENIKYTFSYKALPVFVGDEQPTFEGEI